MAAIAAVFIALFWKRFRGFAAFVTWLAILLTLINSGSITLQGKATDGLAPVFNISLSTAVLIIFVILTLLIFTRSSRRRGIPTPG